MCMSGPSIPESPPPPPPPPPPTPAPTLPDQNLATANSQERARAALAGAFTGAGTIMTSPTGLNSPQSNSPKTLLGS